VCVCVCVYIYIYYRKKVKVKYVTNETDDAMYHKHGVRTVPV